MRGPKIKSFFIILIFFLITGCGDSHIPSKYDDWEIIESGETIYYGGKCEYNIIRPQIKNSNGNYIAKVILYYEKSEDMTELLEYTETPQMRKDPQYKEKPTEYIMENGLNQEEKFGHKFLFYLPKKLREGELIKEIKLQKHYPINFTLKIYKYKDNGRNLMIGIAQSDNGMLYVDRDYDVNADFTNEVENKKNKSTNKKIDYENFAKQIHDAYFSAIKREKYDEAYELLSDDYKKRLGNYDKFVSTHKYKIIDKYVEILKITHPDENTYIFDYEFTTKDDSKKYFVGKMTLKKINERMYIDDNKIEQK